MNREILFKAKCLDDGEWVEGFYFCMVHDDGSHVHHFIMPLGADLSLGTPIEKIQVEIDIETLCQYTGLTDKNGSKIWENDFVREMDFRYLGMVRYIDAGYQIKWNDSYIRTDINFWVRERCLNVVGNVFDNPELLGGD